jgi:hypothetical protein
MMAIKKTASVKKATRTAKPKATAAAGGNGAAAAVAPALDLEEAIRMRAYELYETGGRVYGRALDDWLTAEAEVLSHTR